MAKIPKDKPWGKPAWATQPPSSEVSQSDELDEQYKKALKIADEFKEPLRKIMNGEPDELDEFLAKLIADNQADGYKPDWKSYLAYEEPLTSAKAQLQALIDKAFRCGQKEILWKLQAKYPDSIVDTACKFELSALKGDKHE